MIIYVAYVCVSLLRTDECFLTLLLSVYKKFKLKSAY